MKFEIITKKTIIDKPMEEITLKEAKQICGHIDRCQNCPFCLSVIHCRIASFSPDRWNLKESEDEK